MVSFVPTYNKVALPDFDGVCTTEILPLLPDEHLIDRGYLYSLLLSSKFVKWASANVSGANLPRLGPERLEEYPIALPPLEEQKRIAALLDKADHLRRNRRYALQLTDTFLQSIFLEMFGDPVINPKGWSVFELAEIVKSFEGGINFNPVSENGPKSKWRVLKISSVTSGEFKPYESKAIAPDTTFNPSLIVRKDDLIISRANTTELVGAVCMVRQVPPDVLLPDKLWRIKISEAARIDPNYLLRFLQLPSTRKIIGELATGTSGSMQNISKDKAGTIPILTPPIELQKKFAAIVQATERLRAQQREAERQAEHLFLTLLHRAFSEEENTTRMETTSSEITCGDNEKTGNKLPAYIAFG